MKEKDEIIEKLWEYVHGEADSATKAAIDQAASENKQLRNELDVIKTLDKTLSKLIPVLKVTEQQLEDRIMTAIHDATPAPAHQKKYARQPVMIFHNFRSILATPWFQYGSLLAAAATILVLFSMYHYASPPLRWTKPEIAPLQYRGVTVDAQHASAYTPEQLTECSTSVQSAVTKAFAPELQQTPGRTPTWTLNCRIKELPGQVLCIQVRAYAADRFVHEWTQYYDNLEEFEADLNAMAKRTASDLLNLTAGNTR